MIRFIILFILFPGTLLCQENPWEQKSKTNPWETGTEKKKEKKTVKKDESITEKEKESPKLDTLLLPDSTAQYQLITEDMKYHIRKTARENYKSGADFGVGLTTGLLFSLGGIFIDGIIIIPDNKREKEAVETTAVDSTYQSYDPEVLRKESKRAIKGKKVGSTIGGTIVGAFAQIGVLVILLINA